MTIADIFITVERDPIWASILTGLIGVLAGAVLTILGGIVLGAWNRATDVVSAARVVQLEILSNRYVLRLAIDDGFRWSTPLSDSAWRENARILSEGLEEVALTRLARDCAHVSFAQTCIEMITEEVIAVEKKEEVEKTKSALGKYHDALGARMNDLRNVERRSRIKHLFRILAGRHTAKEAELRKSLDEDRAQL